MQKVFLILVLDVFTMDVCYWTINPIYWMLIGLTSSECLPSISSWSDVCRFECDLGSYDFSNCNAVSLLPADANLTSSETKLVSFSFELSGLTRVLSRTFFGLTVDVLFFSRTFTEFEPESFLNLQTLSIQITDNDELTSFSNDTFKGVQGLLQLVITGNPKLTALPLGLFEGLGLMSQLHLNDNNIQNLNPGLFESNTGLHELLLYGNPLKSLNESIFVGLSELRILRLDKASLEGSLPSGIFRGNVNLRQIQLDNNRLSELPEETFFGLSRLNKVFLNNNRLKTLSGRIFRENSNLRQIHLDNNRLDELEYQVFYKTINLQKLYLNDNNLDSLPSFSKSFALRHLELANNKLSQLSHFLSYEVFKGLKNLRRLVIEGSQISRFWYLSFDGLHNLQWLYLGGNDLYELPSGLFRDTTNLTILELQNNSIEYIANNLFRGLANLKELRLENNYIFAIDVNPFKDLTSLRKLNLENNEIYCFPKKVFHPLVMLREIWIEQRESKRDGICARTFIGMKVKIHGDNSRHSSAIYCSGEHEHEPDSIDCSSDVGCHETCKGLFNPLHIGQAHPGKDKESHRLDYGLIIGCTVGAAAVIIAVLVTLAKYMKPRAASVMPTEACDGM